MSGIKEIETQKTSDFYKTFGVMLDCSRNAVMKTDKLKKFIDYISLFGYNALEIYAEDTVEIKGEKRVGYMRGKYSGEELKEIDAYAKSRGIELIPCVQTLAHFTNVCKIADYNKLFEMGDILFCGEEETYAFIEKIIASCRDNFSSDKINIGMDEAEFVGLGKYLKKNGYKNRFEILKNHLKRVAAICEKYNFRPHMWSDMFFKLTTEDGSYYGKTSDVPKELKDSVPETVSLTYFDYYHQNFEDYDRMIKAHKKLTDNVWFAGGAWTWNGFAPNIGFSINTMKPAMRAVRENGIENVLITVWGDNGKEASYFSVISTLYAIKRFADGEENINVIAKDFKKLTGLDYHAFKNLDLPNVNSLNKEGNDASSASKTFFYCDPFLGLFDKEIETVGPIDFETYAETLKAGAKKAGELKYVFDTLKKFCDFLAVKYDLGVILRKAYKSGDIKTLREGIKRIETCIKRLEVFYKAYKNQWMEENKPFGWEVQDIRIGGLKQRLKYCLEKTRDYIDGKIEKIEELEEEILPFDTEHFPVLSCNFYRFLASPSEI